MFNDSPQIHSDCILRQSDVFCHCKFTLHQPTSNSLAMIYDISYDYPTMLLEDFGRFIDYLESTTVALNPTGTIKGNSLIALNERMHKPVPDVNNRTQERYFPMIFMAKMLALDGGLVYTQNEKKVGNVLKASPRLEDFKALSPVEQYFFLLETFMIDSDWGDLSERMGGSRNASGFQNLFDSEIVEKIRVGEPVKHSYMRFYHYEPLVQFGEYFGWWNIEHINQEQRQKAGMNKGFAAEHISFTDFGMALYAILRGKRNHQRWNKAFRMEHFTEEYPVPGAEVPRNFRPRGLWSDEIPKEVVQAPYRKGEQFYEAFTHLVPPGSLTKTLTRKIQSAEQRMGTHTFKISLQKKIWRRVALSHKHTLDDLHNAIQQAFQFGNDHLYAFFMDGKAWSRKSAYWSPHDQSLPSASKAFIGSIPLHENQQFLYVFDFGSEWHFTVIFEGCDTTIQTPLRPAMLESMGKAPSQYGDDNFDEDEDDEINQSVFASEVRRKAPPSQRASTSAAQAQPQVPEAMQNEAHKAGWKLINFEVTFDEVPRDEKQEKMPSREVVNAINKVAPLLKGTHNLLPYLRQFEVFKKKYPDVPVVYNYLRNIYAMMKESTKAAALDLECYERFPEYVFARTQYARNFLHTDPEKAYTILGGTPSINEAYPKRKVFHISEAMAFYSVLIEYFIGTKNLATAESWLDMIAEIAPDHPTVKNLYEYLERVQTLESLMKSFLFRGKSKKATSRPKKKAEKKKSPTK